jgi:histone H3/H4
MMEERRAVLYAVICICENEATRECVEVEAGTRDKVRPTLSRDSMNFLADVVMKQMDLIALDLQHFAHHAGRKTISTEDVLLCARRQPAVISNLHEFHRVNFLAATRKRKKTTLTDKQL